MNKYAFIKTRTDNLISSICDKANILSRRHDMLFQRQQNLEIDAKSITEVNENEIISINAGGTVFKVKRGSLSLFKGSRLQVVLSGRWGGRLLRDSKGNIFLDIHPFYFEKILEQLYILKSLKNDTNQGMEHNIEFGLSPEEKEKVIFIGIGFLV